LPSKELQGALLPQRGAWFFNEEQLFSSCGGSFYVIFAIKKRRWCALPKQYENKNMVI